MSTLRFRRWEALTGKSATLITGETFEEIAEQRTAAVQTLPGRGECASDRRRTCRSPLRARLSDTSSRPVKLNSSRESPATRGGRPKRKVNMSESLNRVLDDKIVVTGFGKGKTGLEAFVQSVVDRVLQGDSKGIPALISAVLTRPHCLKPTPRPGQMTGVVVMPPEYWDDPARGT